MRLAWSRQEQAEPHGINEWLQERRPGGARYRKVLALVRLPADEGGGFETRACYEAPSGAFMSACHWKTAPGSSTP